MNTVERVKTICKERGIALAKLESDCGFGNAYISGLKKGVIRDDRLGIIAEYLDVSADYLRTGEENPSFSPENAKLVSMIRADKNMNNFLLKYFKLSKEKREKILSAVNMIMDGMENDWWI